jgi:aspartate-semialdehyde dehydrogenase
MKKKEKYNIAVAGATGLVGRTILKVLEERNFPVGELYLYASERSVGIEIPFKGKNYFVEDLSKADFGKSDLALFSAGAIVGIEYAPKFVDAGCIVIDNGSGWRMDPEVPLVVPEVNHEMIFKHNGIIANPNCSTIELVVALKPLQDIYGLKRIIVSTYQSVSGAGQKGLATLYNELYFPPEGRISDNQYAFNTVFHPIKDPSGFSVEEIKMVNETRKIMSLPDLPIAVTCVRLPVIGGHGESINVELNKPYDLEEVRQMFGEQPGIVLIDKPLDQSYPTVKISQDTDPVYVGRLRRDVTIENGLQMWITADNVRKGAATNAVQIAEVLVNGGNL